MFKTAAVCIHPLPAACQKPLRTLPLQCPQKIGGLLFPHSPEKEHFLPSQRHCAARDDPKIRSEYLLLRLCCRKKPGGRKTCPDSPVCALGKYPLRIGRNTFVPPYQRIVQIRYNEPYVKIHLSEILFLRSGSLQSASLPAQISISSSPSGACCWAPYTSLSMQVPDEIFRSKVILNPRAASKNTSCVIASWVIP